MDKFAVLKEYFGHKSFRNGQEEIIDSIISGRDVVGIMPTGAGKSLCYQVPAIMMDGVTIVISPLISLMKDQVSSLTDNGISAAMINSTLTAAEYSDTMQHALHGDYKLIYIAPERLETEDVSRIASSVDISMITIDEAHCVSQWGQDFRPSYIRIAEFINSLPKRPVVSAFTATATPVVKEDIIRLLGLHDPFPVTTGFDRPNLYYSVLKPGNKYSELRRLLKEYGDRCGIVYCISRKNVDEVCEKLDSEGFPVTKYHAGLSDNERKKNQDDFIYDRKRIIVATNAFGMGIDKSDVSFVIHYNMPKDVESYYQEAGRAGRDGSPADCTILYSPQDVRINNFMIEKSREENSELSEEENAVMLERDRKRLKEMTFYSTTPNCLRGYILNYFGEKAPSYCGNCFNCLNGFEEIDVTCDVQKILSCVFRIKQKGRSFGKTMIIDVLRGSKSERIRSFGLDEISTYGIMEETSTHRIRAEIDHLIHEGYLACSDEKYPVITLTASAAKILKEKVPVKMKLPNERTVPVKNDSDTGKNQVDKALFEKLRALRRELANEANLPAFIIFNDAALTDMCRILPTDKNAFLTVSGVGKQKAEKYGDDFCRVISEYINSDNNKT